MTLRRTLPVAAACAGLFGASLAAGNAILDDEDSPRAGPTRSAPPAEPAPRPRLMALGRAAELPRLRYPTRAARRSSAQASASPPALPPTTAPPPADASPPAPTPVSERAAAGQAPQSSPPAPPPPTKGSRPSGAASEPAAAPSAPRPPAIPQTTWPDPPRPETPDPPRPETPDPPRPETPSLEGLLRGAGGN
jgi:hypothetical protein